MSRPLFMCACAYAALAGANAHSADGPRGQFQRPLRIVVNSTTPKLMQSALHELVARTIESAEVKVRLAREGAEPFLGDTPARYAAFITAEIAKWWKIVRWAGIQPQ